MTGVQTCALPIYWDCEALQCKYYDDEELAQVLMSVDRLFWKRIQVQRNKKSRSYHQDRKDVEGIYSRKSRPPKLTFGNGFVEEAVVVVGRKDEPRQDEEKGNANISMLNEVSEELGKVRCEFFVIVVENHDQGGEKSHRCQLWKKVSLFGFNHNFFRFDVIRLKKAVAHIFALMLHRWNQ